MDEVWARAAVVAGALAVAGVVVVVQRWVARRPVRTSSVAGLPPGLYLFSSSGCDSCQRARDMLDAELGSAGYHEISWEERGGDFAVIGVDAVPAVLIVEPGGRGRLYPGRPDRALKDWAGLILE